MFSFNQIILIGKTYNIKDFKTQSGEDMVTATLQFQNYRNKKTENLYFDIVMFNKNANNFKLYVKDLDVIQVVGKMVYDTYENKEGKNVRNYKIMVDRFLKLRAAYADELKEDETLRSQINSNIDKTVGIDDDIPF